MEKERKERGRGSSRETGKWREKGKVKSPGWEKKSPGWVAFQEVSVVFVCAFTRGLSEGC